MLDKLCSDCPFFNKLHGRCAEIDKECQPMLKAIIAIEESEEIREPIGGWNPEAEEGNMI